MYFALPAFLLLAFYVGQELELRRKSKLPLASWKELASFLFKKNRAPVYDQLRRPREFYLYAFASLCAVLFGSWESMLWMLFGRPGLLVVGAAGLALFGMLLLRRRKTQRALSEEPRPGGELFGVWLAFALCVQPLFTAIVFSPWVAYRSFKIKGPGARAV